MLEAYALMQQSVGAAHGTELVTLLRNDVDPDELASYWPHALSAAAGLPTTAAVHRPVAVTLAGLHPPR